jgi:hypothetical protein
MRRYLLAATALAALSVVPAGARAQLGSPVTISRGAFAVVPYAGYLVSESFIDGPLDTSLGAVSAPMFGVQASLPLASFASLVGSVGYASGDLEVGLPVLGGISIGDSNALLADAAIELRVPGGRFVPVFQLGGGVLRRELTVAGVSASASDFQVTGGIGADIPLVSNLGLRILAKDHYGKSDFGGVGEFRARTDDLHNVALTAGLQFSF